MTARWQACNGSLCLRPQAAALGLPVQITGPEHWRRSPSPALRELARVRVEGPLACPLDSPHFFVMVFSGFFTYLSSHAAHRAHRSSRVSFVAGP